MEIGGVRDVWIEQDDREGKGYVWGTPPGGNGGEENGGMVQFDGQGDVVMVDISDFEMRRWRQKGRQVEQKQKPWWQRGPMDFD